ncbi:MAG: protein-methionine-sulfoxide reductase catalytic subunit MsrP [Terrimicrobiaceae bacterium]|nr:protein-methionine-sulfoxide reductase catalytic subunit MsrP [Terrimicrobiaceae bacterium]
MHIVVPPTWSLPDSSVAPEAIYRGRRDFLKLLGFGVAAAAIAPEDLLASAAEIPARLNPAHRLDGLRLTKENAILGYNNYIEFSLVKEGPRIEANKGFRARPWSVDITGLVEKPLSLDVDELVRTMGGIEQRNYRHRCVETWSMVIPWDGFPLSRLIQLVQPKPEARFVKFTSFLDTDAAPNQNNPLIPWPYTEGLTIAEAANELTFLATGIYGKPLANQNGAPLRLVVPWKYGFKGIKAITEIAFTDGQPATLWNQVAPAEYGFYANVNPTVDHPRWSQAREFVLGGGIFDGKKPTLMFNGYASEVAGLYRGLDLRKNY